MTSKAKVKKKKKNQTNPTLLLKMIPRVKLTPSSRTALQIQLTWSGPLFCITLLHPENVRSPQVRFFFKTFLLWPNAHNVKSTTLTTLTVQFSGTKYIYNIMQPSAAFWFQPIWNLHACGQHAVNIFHLVGVKCLQSSSKDMIQNIICRPWGRTKGPSIFFLMAKLLLFYLACAFSHFSVKFTLWNSGKAYEAKVFLQTRGRGRNIGGGWVCSGKAP